MHLQLPETLDHWPWMRILNVHYDQVKHDSQLWLEGFQPFSPEAQNAFEKCEFALLASLAYPYFSKTQLRAGADLMNVFFVFDEYTDVENEIVVAQLGIEIMDGLRNPHKCCNIKGGSILRKMAAEFWANTMSIATLSCQAHFLHACHEYVLSVVEQARDRSGNKVRSIQDYLEVRRLAAGVYPSLALLELDLDLSDHVISHPAMKTLTRCAVDIIALGNDIYSFNVEQARGDGSHNIITVVMMELKLDLHEALEWVGHYHRERELEFLRAVKELPMWSPEIDRQVAQYVNGIGNWVRANDCWSFESGRYFGQDGLRVQETRMVTLAPKVA
ncbi:terpenoid synthase [Lentinula edodes]|nr:terpenoid synthase [Lentinula edodes]